MAVSELVPGKLYTQCIDPRAIKSGRWRTVMCVKYEQWRIYKKITLIVLGQPNKPIIEEFIDKFRLKDWLAQFHEVPDDEQ